MRAADSPSRAAVPVVVLCCDGLYQRHLIRRAAETFDLRGVVLQIPPPKPRRQRLRHLLRYADPMTLIRQLRSRWLLRRYERRGQALQRQLFCGADGHPPEGPSGVPILTTTAINGDDVVAFLSRLQPDLVLVNGTQLLRQPVLDLLPRIRHGIVNLHTGLSPYARGANCNLYMILENHPELVGVTVHRIDPGIDSGEILLSAQVPMEPDDNFETLDARSFHVGIELLLQGARRLAAGQLEPVPQWERGKLFLRRTGYHYEPSQRLEANRRIEAGLLRDYLAHQSERDLGVRLIGMESP